MKAAAAVLGASLLFFLGVLTGTGRREAVPPPSAIPLGVLTPAGAAGTPGHPGTPAAPSGNPARAPQSTSSTGKATTTTTVVPMANTVTTTATGSPKAPSPPDASGGITTTTAPAATTSTTAPGRVEQVDNQVDCSPAGKKGKGRKDACPSSTESTAGGPGRGAGR